MNLARISLADLRARAGSTLLNLTLLALGVASVVVILLVSAQLEERLERDAEGIDLVIGAKGSPMQIVLSSLYQLDVPGGAISWTDAQRLGGDLAVRTGIPIALADNYWGYRIVGTTPDYISHYGGVLDAGRAWQAPFEAVLGADVAARMHSSVGSTFVAAHGVRATREAVHEGQRYQVVGVLKRTGTVVDRLVMTDIASVARAHVVAPEVEDDGLVTEPPTEDTRQVTAVLVQCISAAACETLAAKVNAEHGLQAALPRIEIDRLFRFIGVGADVLWGFALILMLVAGLSVFIALYNALRDRRQDLAIMRALGAGPGKLMALLLLEGVTLAGAGAVAGIALGHAFTSALGLALSRTQQVSLTGLTWSVNELWVVLLALAVGLAASLIPASQARKIDIGATLARG